jgi:hypothetical protein
MIGVIVGSIFGVWMLGKTEGLGDSMGFICSEGNGEAEVGRMDFVDGMLLGKRLGFNVSRFLIVGEIEGKMEGSILGGSISLSEGKLEGIFVGRIVVSETDGYEVGEVESFWSKFVAEGRLEKTSVGLFVKRIKGTLEIVTLGTVDFLDAEGIELGWVDGISTKVGLDIKGDWDTCVGILNLKDGRILGVLVGSWLLMSEGKMLGILEVGVLLSGWILGNDTGIIEIGGVVGPFSTTGLSVIGVFE